MLLSPLASGLGTRLVCFAAGGCVVGDELHAISAIASNLEPTSRHTTTSSPRHAARLFAQLPQPRRAGLVARLPRRRRYLAAHEVLAGYAVDVGRAREVDRRLRALLARQQERLHELGADTKYERPARAKARCD